MTVLTRFEKTIDDYLADPTDSVSHTLRKIRKEPDDPPDKGEKYRKLRFLLPDPFGRETIGFHCEVAYERGGDENELGPYHPERMSTVLAIVEAARDSLGLPMTGPSTETGCRDIDIVTSNVQLWLAAEQFSSTLDGAKVLCIARNPLESRLLNSAHVKTYIQAIQAVHGEGAIKPESWQYVFLGLVWIRNQFRVHLLDTAHISI